MEQARHPIQMNSLCVHIIEREICVEYGRNACARTLKSAAENAFHWIIQIENLLHIGGRRVGQASIECPFVFRAKSPAAVEFQVNTQVGRSLPAAHGSFCEAEVVRRIFQVASEILEVKIIEPRVRRLQMSLKRGPAERPLNLSAKRQRACNPAGCGIFSAYHVDEII